MYVFFIKIITAIGINSNKKHPDSEHFMNYTKYYPVGIEPTTLSVIHINLVVDDTYCHIDVLNNISKNVGF